MVFLFINFPIGQCQSDEYIWNYSLSYEDEQTESNSNGIGVSNKNADIDFTGRGIPFFFWLFLIMAGLWYLFVFRVLCCDQACGNSDVDLGMIYLVKSPIFIKQIYTFVSTKVLSFLNKYNLFF